MMKETKYIKELKEKWKNYTVLSLCSIILFGFFIALSVIRYPGGISVVLGFLSGVFFALSFMTSFMRSAMEKAIAMENVRGR